ncbi:MAG: hypothetical protein EBW73_05135, partial [Betaproteobacteria bacterium]|nr:hypothetical protein [Betaproteobacteria bacterium]
MQPYFPRFRLAELVDVFFAAAFFDAAKAFERLFPAAANLAFNPRRLPFWGLTRSASRLSAGLVNGALSPGNGSAISLPATVPFFDR